MNNNDTNFHPFILAPIFIWIGFVCAISFMEAWLKFQAPNVSLSTGLSIGKLVFGVLNKLEWCFSGIIIAFMTLSKKPNTNKTKIFFYIALLTLILQTGYLLPLLNERVENIAKGIQSPYSNIHIIYICIEVVKVISLSLFGTKIIFNLSKTEYTSKN